MKMVEKDCELNLRTNFIPGYGVVEYLISNRNEEKNAIQNTIYTMNYIGLTLYNGAIAKLFLDEFSNDIGKAFSFLEKMF